MVDPVVRAQVIADEEIVPGDIVRSKYGRTVRTIVDIDGDNVMLRGSRGAVDVIPARSIRQFWRKIGKEG